jgi:hypothetical protein
VSEKEPRHNHFTRDIKEPGKCPACDAYHARHPVAPPDAEPQEVPTEDEATRKHMEAWADGMETHAGEDESGA